MEDHTDGEDIAARVDPCRLSLSLLRGHVLRRTDQGLGSGDDGPGPEHLGDAEVQHLDEVVTTETLAEEDVLRLEIAVHDSPAVGCSERRNHLGDDPERLVHVEPANLLQSTGEVLAIKKLQDDVGLPVVGPVEVDGLDDVRVTELARDHSFLPEARHGLAGCGDVLVQELDRKAPSQTQMRRLEDRPHPPSSDEAFELVGATNHRTQEITPHLLLALDVLAGCLRLGRPRGRRGDGTDHAVQGGLKVVVGLAHVMTLSQRRCILWARSSWSELGALDSRRCLSSLLAVEPGDTALDALLEMDLCAQSQVSPGTLDGVVLITAQQVGGVPSHQGTLPDTQ